MPGSREKVTRGACLSIQKGPFAKQGLKNCKTYDNPADSGWQAPQRVPPPPNLSHLLCSLAGPRGAKTVLHDAKILSSGWALYKTISWGFFHFFMGMLQYRTNLR